MAKKTSQTKKTSAQQKTASPKKTAAKKSAAKKTVTKKTAAQKKPVSKKSAKKSPSPKAARKPASKKKSAAPKAAPVAASKSAKGEKAEPKTKRGAKKASVARTNGADKKATPIVFSIDDVEAFVKAKAERKDEQPKESSASQPGESKAGPQSKAAKSVVDEKPVEKRVLGAASLADILGFNPAAKKKDTQLEEDDIPKKWKKYYKLLIELRDHVRDELDLHTADTLKHSSREDSGDLANYGNHQADAGTDTFDRDFALSLVSNEQEALNEIEEAILRIKNGNYGVCEVTGEPISKERLEAVPFARFSVEGQAEYEKNKRRKTDRSPAGLFADASDGPKIASDEDED